MPGIWRPSSAGRYRAGHGTRTWRRSRNVLACLRRCADTCAWVRWVCVPPAHDPDFGVADFLVLLALDRVDSRYLRHFLGHSRGAEA